MSKLKILNDSVRIDLLSLKDDQLTVTIFIPKPFVGIKKSQDFDDVNYGLYISNLFTGILFNRYDYGNTITIGILGFKIDIWWAHSII